MQEQETADCSEWTTYELFLYAMRQEILEPDALYEDWKNDRAFLSNLVQDDLDNS